MNNYPFASMRDCFDMSAYFVVGPQDCKGRPVTDVVDDALRGGATFIQLRAKNADAKDITEMARDIAQVIKNSGKSDSVAFVIDDRVDVVWQARDKGIKVDGVHIGQTDMEPQEARALLGEDAFTVGVYRATGNHNARLGIIGDISAYQFAEIQNGPFGHRAAVDENDVGQGWIAGLHEALVSPGFTNGLRLVLVHLAALGDDEEQLPCFTPHGCLRRSRR